MRLLRRILKRKKPRIRRSTSTKNEAVHDIATPSNDVYQLPAEGILIELSADNEICGEMVDRHNDVPAIELDSIAVNLTGSSQEERTDFDEIASIESGDQLSWKQDDILSDATASRGTYLVYEKLELAVGEFRILSLQPAKDKAEDIHCRLMKDYLRSESGNKSIYEALSYTWGEAKEMHIIFVNNQPFPVTPNLFIALKYLRKAEESRVLWIDAICIDQNSLLEKTHQVGMMRDIYRGASQVLIWLGESDKEIRKAMAFLEQRKRFQLLTRDELDPFVAGLAKIFRQPWWSRIWVVQEVLVASKPPLLGCGRRWLSWEDVETGLVNLKRHQTTAEFAESSFEHPMAFNDLALTTSDDYSDGHPRRRSRSKDTGRSRGICCLHGYLRSLGHAEKVVESGGSPYCNLQS